MTRHFFATIVLLLCSAAVFAQPKDWANFSRYEQSNRELIESGQKVKVVFMGNSITDNWAKFDPDFFTDNGFVGRGISGQTTSQMLVRFRRDVVDLKPKAVAILAGINDIAQNNGPISLDNVLGNIVSMCEIAKANRIKVFICSVLPCDRFSWRPSIQPAPLVKELNGMLRDYASRNKITFVDYWTVMADKNGALPSEIAPDGCHPTLEGYKIMEDIFLQFCKY